MKKRISPLLLIVLLVSGMLPNGYAQVKEITKDPRFKEAPQVFYYGAEINGILAGYSVTVVGQANIDDKNVLLIEENIHIDQSVLGGNYTTDINFEYHTDPVTGMYNYYRYDMVQATVKRGSQIVIKGNKAYFTAQDDETAKEIDLPGDILLENSQYYPHLVKKFFHDGATELNASVLDASKGELQKIRYSLMGDTTLVSYGNKYNTLVVKMVNFATGITSTLFLDKESAMMVQMTTSTKLKIYVADKSVMKQINTVNMDEVLFGKVNKLIPDIMGITRMEVKAKIRTAGEWKTPEALNVPHQKFTGKVEDNVIDGIFTISHPRYDGKDAPAFPTHYAGMEALQRYLEPEDFIESTDPVLIQKAQEITAGMKDSWRAAIQLSRWVSDNIDGAVPGGVTARKTYDIRAGECSGHSRLLTAFCRAVGIPARVVVGCMYNTYYGGSFGQHAWVEIYMGKNGWIPVDATIGETDYVDCGHIRLGEKATFNPVEMEILHYEVNGKDPEEANRDIKGSGKYQKYLGEYHDLVRNRTFTMALQDGQPVVKVPGGMVLAVKDPDEEGNWYAKLTNRVYFGFTQTGDGTITGMVLHQITPMQKQSEADSIPEDVPQQYRAYLGKYLLAQVQGVFEVSWRNHTLAIFDPFEKKYIGFQSPDEKGRWMDEFNQNAITFIKEDDGRISAMNLLQSVTMEKGTLGVPIIKEAILNHGIQAGISQYRALKEAVPGKYLITEAQMNALGYELMEDNRIKAAIEVFKLNVQEYPESWNVYDSLGEAYMKDGQTREALKNYRKSVALNPDNENGKKKISELKAN